MTALTLAGVPLEVGPAARLTGIEKRVLQELSDKDSARASTTVRGFRLELEDATIDELSVTAASTSDPATVTADGGRIGLSHQMFQAVVDLTTGSGVLKRDPRTVFPLQVTLRVIMCGQLPAMGMVPLHAAGVLIGADGVGLFGPSGAGKTTIAGVSPHPVLSDELVVVGGSPPRIMSSSFFPAGCVTGGSHPLKGLVELARGTKLSMVPLDPTEAFRRLLNVLMIPHTKALWRASLQVLAGLVGEVPSWRLSWSLTHDPWPAVVSSLRSTGESPGRSVSHEIVKGSCH